MSASAQITQPRKYAFDRRGRVRHVARVLGIKLPAWKGRRPKEPKGDDSKLWYAFGQADGQHRKQNPLRIAMESVLDLAGSYRDQLTADECRQLARVAERAFVGKAVSK